MRNIRHYVDAPLDMLLAAGTPLTLPESAQAHLIRVLRLGIGDTCTLFNGDGYDYTARVFSIEKKSARVELLTRCEVSNESLLSVTLAQSLARGEKMDWILQKATELGVTRIAPIITERTEVRLDAERSEKKMSHWRGVLAAACEQCGRARIPELLEPTSLSDFVISDNSHRRFVLHPGDGLTLANANITPQETVSIVIGPEGGLSERDLTQLRTAHIESLTLGPRILRTETAGIAALAALQTLYGDWC